MPMAHIADEHQEEFEALNKREVELSETITGEAYHLIHSFAGAKAVLAEERMNLGWNQNYDMDIIRAAFNTEFALVEYVSKLESIVQSLTGSHSVSFYLNLRGQARELMAAEENSVDPDSSAAG